MVAKAKKKAVKKKAKEARGPSRARKAAVKKRAKRPASKAGKSAKTTAATKKASKQPSKNSAKKAKTNKRGSPAGKTKVAAAPPPVSKPSKPRAAKPARAAKPITAPAKNSFYITTAIAYPNGVPHIGHAYEAIATDALARFARLDGKDVFFLTGTDEHGLKMVQTAEAEKLPTMEVATRNAQRFKEMDERLNVSFDRFIRTTEKQHHRSSQEIWRRMADSGDIYLDSYAGWYSVRDEAYYAEDETVVGEDEVRRGTQGTPVEWVEEKSYFFRLSAFQDRLLKLYESQPDFIGPDSAQERSNQLRQEWPARSVDLAHHLRLGRQGARRRRTRDVCLGRRADQLHYRRRLS